MAEQQYYVVGGEYADTSFTVPASGTTLEMRGPFSERDAKTCWRDLTGKTVDNAMVRYFLKAEDQINGKIYWVVGGEYANSSFTTLQAGKELEVYGPFEKWEALGFWRGLTSKSVDDALVRYDIRENYQPGDAPSAAAGKVPAGAKSGVLQPAATKSVAITASPRKIFDFLMDGRNWPKWAIHTVKAARSGKDGDWELDTPRGTARLKLKGDVASGVVDHTFTDAGGDAWIVPGRVVPSGGGAVYVLTYIQPINMGDAEFKNRMSQMDDELSALKRTVESGS
jgi:hypothetical protein